jgi:hypothetical protein
MTGQFESIDQTLHAGWLLGHLKSKGVDAVPVMEGTDYTPVILIKIPKDEAAYSNIFNTLDIEVRVLP